MTRTRVGGKWIKERKSVKLGNWVLALTAGSGGISAHSRNCVLVLTAGSGGKSAHSRKGWMLGKAKQN